MRFLEAEHSPDRRDCDDEDCFDWQDNPPDNREGIDIHRPEAKVHLPRLASWIGMQSRVIINTKKQITPETIIVTMMRTNGRVSFLCFRTTKAATMQYWTANNQRLNASRMASV
jgi:hypothetical protein